MSKPKASARSENRELELPLTPRGVPPGTETPPPQREGLSAMTSPGVSVGESPTGAGESPAPPVSEPKQVKIVVRVVRAGDTSDAPVPSGDPPPDRMETILQTQEDVVSTTSLASVPVGESPIRAGGVGGSPAPQAIPARMMNEFVYCQRLFYYEFVEGVFVESADTLRGDSIHQRVDSGSGALPAAKQKAKAEKPNDKQAKAEADAPVGAPERRLGAGLPSEPEIIHSRSVQMGSERLGIVAKMDLIEVRAANVTNVTLDPINTGLAGGADGDLLAAVEVCPVDYKAGAPKEGAEANELWDTYKMQLGLQSLILRDNGYACNDGVIYYRATKQRVRLPITPELEKWILEKIAEARRVVAAPMPAPLVHSPKCVRCSLATVCLPDETRMLAQTAGSGTDGQDAQPTAVGEPPRRLIAARDDTRPLYLNTPGYRVGCKDEVLQIKDKDSVVDEVRMRDVSHVALFGNVQISTQAIQSLCEQEVPVTYFSMGGWFYGITRGHALKNVFLRMEQFRLAREEKTCLSLARQFVHGKIRNHRTLLMRNHLEPPEATIGKLKRAAEDALVATSLEELLGIEGAAASQYFQQFSGMVKVEDDLPGLEMPVPDEKQRAFNFNFNHRNRRPPTDPVNAMLSLAYSMLAKDCTLAVLAVGFERGLGIFSKSTTPPLPPHHQRRTAS